MNYVKKFNKFNNENSILLIVDVQKSFRKFFSEMYLYELNKYCKTFKSVYQIFDNHVYGNDVDKNYLYKDNPDILVHNDLYRFPNQVDLIEKRYNYNVNADFYKKILDKDTYKNIKNKEYKKSLKKGDIFKTKEGTVIVYIGNNHVWFHAPKKLYNILKQSKDKVIYIVGGSDSECLEDIFILANSLGLEVKRNHKYIYSANHCPIK